MKIIKGHNEGLSLEEFKKLYDANFEKVRNYIYYKCADIELAEDIAQDSFVKLWEKRRELKKTGRLAYLYRIALNNFINQANRKKLDFRFQYSGSSDDINVESPEFELEKKEFNQKLQQALAGLTEKNREVFLMNRIDGLKYREIAEMLDLSIKAVEKRMQAALDQLKQQLNHKL